MLRRRLVANCCLAMDTASAGPSLRALQHMHSYVGSTFYLMLVFHRGVVCFETQQMKDAYETRQKNRISIVLNLSAFAFLPEITF